MRSFRFAAYGFVACLALVLVGCAEIDVPRPDNIIKNPLGAGSVKVGMSKTKVVDIYGEPDMKDQVASGEWNGTREEWFYAARYSALPVSAGYLAEDAYFYFDGDNLTNISKTKLGKQESGQEKGK